MVKALYTIHILFLSLALLLSVVARFIVGAAGHSSQAGTGDYVALTYLVVSFIAMMLSLKTKSFENALLTLNIALLAAGVLSILYIIGLQVFDGDIIFALIIPELLFAINALMLIYHLYRRKPSLS